MGDGIAAFSAWYAHKKATLRSPHVWLKLIADQVSYLVSGVRISTLLGVI